jgi:hypothetical protein
MRFLFLLLSAFVLHLAAQGRPDPAAMISAQRTAMAPLAWMNGVWRGPAWTLREGGDKHSITQTERIGPLLDGSVKVLEGRGYDPDGKVTFNAFGTISYDLRTKAYTLHSYAQGFAGDFPLRVTADGYVWEIPAGPGATIRYTATFKDGEWLEVGDRVVSGQPPARMFEMRLKRVSDTDWPAAGAVPMK